MSDIPEETYIIVSTLTNVRAAKHLVCETAFLAIPGVLESDELREIALRLAKVEAKINFAMGTIDERDLKPAFDPNTARCDREVFERGETICSFHAKSIPTEAWVRKVAATSGQRVDWHYIGGYARVAFIGDREKVRAAVEVLLPELAAAKPERFQMIDPDR